MAALLKTIEYVEKKSRFVGYLFECKSASDVEKFRN